MMMDGNLLVTILRISILKITATLDLVVCDSVDMVMECPKNKRNLIQCSNVPTNPITITRIFPHWPMEQI